MIRPRAVTALGRARGFALALAFACLLPALVTSAPAASIQATIDRETIALGETAVLKVTVQGGTGNDTPRIPGVNGLRFSLAGNSMSFSFESGRQSLITETTYTVTPSRVGAYTIGPVSIGAGGQRIQSDPVSLNVVAANDPRAARPADPEQPAFLELVVPDREVYVGESFAVEIHLYAVGGRLQQAPQLSADGFTIGKLQDAGQQGNIRVNNRIYTRARFIQTVTAARTGELVLQAANCILDIPLPRRGGLAIPFDDVFLFRENQRFTLSTPPATLKVIPLPREGMPQGFNGAVGDFELAVSAAPTQLSAGDPITVRIDIQGRGNFDSVQLPEQPAWRGFRLYPPTANLESTDPSGLTGKKRFEQIVTPESADITSLPSFTFAFFHPESRTYKTVRSQAIPLRVEAGAPAPSLPSPASSVADNAAAKPDLAPLKPHLGTVVVPPSLWMGQPSFLALALGPPLLWIALRLGRMLRARRSADEEARRRADLERRIAKGLASLGGFATQQEAEPFFAALFRTLQEAVALRTGQAPASITEGSLDSGLSCSGIGPETVATLHRLFQVCNQARYARVATAADLDALRAEAQAVCGELQSARTP